MRAMFQTKLCEHEIKKNLRRKIFKCSHNYEYLSSNIIQVTKSPLGWYMR